MELVIPLNVVFIILFLANYIIINLFNWWAREIDGNSGGEIIFYLVFVILYIVCNILIINHFLITP